jgi:hypothetical protein
MVSLISKAFGILTPTPLSPDLQNSVSKKSTPLMRQMNIAQNLPLDPNRTAPKIGATIHSEADYKFATKRNALTRVNGQYRTFLVIDPANGQIPTGEVFNGFHDDHKAKTSQRTMARKLKMLARDAYLGAGSSLAFPYAMEC